MDKNIGIIGLGYVGLPLAIEFSKKYLTVGFDINLNRISQLKNFNDSTLEISSEQLKFAYNNGFNVTSVLKDIQNCNIYIITVPTPIDVSNKPNLRPLIDASRLVGSILKKGDIVIYESTVYPGLTEEECVPILESISNLEFNNDFHVGYSPERINPGDKLHTVSKIKKVTSGSTPEAAIIVDNLYNSVIEAGTFMASSIKVAEASKVIENSQRDINIAFVNELSKIFNLLGIDTWEVLEAAGSKWNFLNFKPGLVGGHCIGVDPYYLAHKAQEVGYHPEIILAGRRLNDGMAKYVAYEVIKLLIKNNLKVAGGKILVMGITFKENCPDVRNTKVVDLIKELSDFGLIVDVIDPWANSEQVFDEYGINLIERIAPIDYSVAILAVAHDFFNDLSFKNSLSSSTLIYDIKGFYEKSNVDARL
uniref:nucleotide sugar dehydrogenase n=1 Tax=Algoriphagus sp. TaxID=1872435 RepID=UPI0040482332